MRELFIVRNGTRRMSTKSPVVAQVWPEQTKPLVRICCWAYNHERFVEQFIKSVIMQKTEFPTEIIIHDDVSTDRTSDILKRYQEKYPNFFRNVYQTQNQYSSGGDISAALFGHARGEFVALCEGDDFWTDNEKLQKQVDFLMQNHHLCGVFHKGFAVNESGERIPFNWDKNVYQCEYSQIECLANLKSGYPTASLMFRVVAYPDNHPKYFREAMCDFCMDIMLTEYGPLGFQDFEGSAYRQHSGGIWSTLTLAEMQATMVKRLIAFYRDEDLRRKYPELKGIVHRRLDAIWWQVFQNSPNSWTKATLASFRLAFGLGLLRMLRWLVRPSSPARFKLRDILLKK